MSAALQVEALNRAFGALPVTRDVNLTLERARGTRSSAPMAPARPHW